MPTKIEDSEYFSLQEIAEMVSVSRQTLWRWRQEGKMPQGRSFRGRSLLFSEAELALVKQRAHELTVPKKKEHSGAFLDNAATTKPLSEVVLAMEKAMSDFFGNAASAHERGLVMRRVIGEARESIAALCGSESEEVIFTSGCTESNNWVILQRDEKGRSPWKKIVTTRIEHSSVKNAVQVMESWGTEVEWLDTPSEGRISAQELENVPLDENTLLAVQWANNETGIQNDVLAIAEVVKNKGAYFLCDAAQAFGKTPINFNSSNIDYLTVSSHKIHGPQGVGAIISHTRAPLSSLLYGGTQEGGKRPGTENSVGIAGFGTAAAIRKTNFGSLVDKCRNIKNLLENEMQKAFPAIQISGSHLSRLCHISNFRIPNLDGQSIVAQLNSKGIFVSQSSACTNMKPEPSYVLTEMGYSEEEAYEAIRVGISENNSISEIERFVSTIIAIAQKDCEFNFPITRLEA
jgi:cysteine desulfurase